MVFKLIRTVLGLESSDSSSETELKVEREPDDTAADLTPEATDDGASDDGDKEEVAVDEVSGIGPAYAERLGEVGVETTADLIDADHEELADSTDISEKRISRWQDRAEDA